MLVGEAGSSPSEAYTISAPAAKIRRGKDVRLVIANDEGRSDCPRDDVLVALLGEARSCYDLVIARPERSLKQLALKTNRCRERFAQLVRVAMLAPDIIENCLDGTQPMRMTARTLLAAELPISWDGQRRLLGFA